MYALPAPLQLEDAQALHQQHPQSFECPTLSKVRAVQVGDLVEVVFSAVKDVCVGENM